MSKTGNKSGTNEDGIDWNMQLYRTAAVAALSYVNHFSTIILSTKMTIIHLPFLCLCPAPLLPKKRKDLNIYCSMDSFVHHMHHSFLTHSFLPFFMAQEIIINKLHAVFNTVVLDPGKYERVFLSQSLTLV